MARYRESTFIQDHAPQFLAGVVLGLLAVLLIGGSPRYSPVLKDLIFSPGDAPPAGSSASPSESTVPSGQEAPPQTESPAEEDGAASSESASPSQADEAAPVPAEGQSLGKWLWSKVTKLWPVLLVLIAVMEAAEYIGKFFALIRKFFHFLSDQF